MTNNEHPGEEIEEPARDGYGLNRRTALKGGVAGLTALGMGGFATSPAAAHHKDGHGGDDDGDGGSGGESAANQFRFAGEEWTVARATSDSGNRISDIVTLLELNGIKQSSSWQDSLYLNTSVESSLLTNVKLSGGADRSRAVAGVFGWVEISEAGEGDWQMITADNETTDPPTAGALEEILDDREQGLANLTKGVVAFNTRDFELEWDLMELIEQAMLEVIQAIDELREIYDDIDDYYDNRVVLDGSFDEHEAGLVDDGMDPGLARDFVDSLVLLYEDAGGWEAYQDDVAAAEDFADLEAMLLDLDIFLRAYLKTKSANGFNWVTTGTAGEHDLRLRGALVVFVGPDDDEDVEAQAVVGSRTMIAQPVKIKAAISSRDEPA